MAGSGGREYKAGRALTSGDEAPPESVEVDPRAAQARALMRQANAFNAAHPDLVAEFNKLTQGKCAGNAAGGVSVMLVRKWQIEHGLKGDGKIGHATLDAARAEASQKTEATVERIVPADKTRQTGGAADSDANGGEVLANPNLLDNISEGAVREEKRKGQTLGEKLEQPGGAAQDVNEGLHHFGGLEEQPWLKAAMAPAIVEMLRERDYAGAVKALAKTFKPSEVIEALTWASERLGLHVAVEVFEKLAEYGGELNVTLEMVMWTYEGLMAIAEAHEAGDRDSRITIYASAFADGFLYGEKAPGNAGAVTEEQRQAAECGRRDGILTAGRTGELAPAIGNELLRRYGSARNARQAIIDKLLDKGGIAGIKTHEGK